MIIPSVITGGGVMKEVVYLTLRTSLARYIIDNVQRVLLDGPHYEGREYRYL